MDKKCEWEYMGNLQRQVEIMFFCPVRHYFGHQAGRNGVRWKNPAKNGLFLEVFGTFDKLPDTVFNPNFKRMKKVTRYTLLVSFRKFDLT